MKEGRPNIIFILLDTFRADYLSNFGGPKRLKTLEEIASKGTTYKHAIAPGTYTVPSHVSFFLGRRVLNIPELIRGHEMDTKTEYIKFNYLPKDAVTVASKLSHLGYSTALFSSNAFLDTQFDTVNGFSYAKGSLIATTRRHSKVVDKVIDGLLGNESLRNKVVVSPIKLLAKLRSREQLDEFFLNMMTERGKQMSKVYGYYSLDRGAKLVNETVANYLESPDSSSKFMFINYMEAHEGYPTNLVTNEYVEQEKWLYMSHIIDPAPIKYILKARDKRIEYLDGKIAELMKTLKKQGVLDNATVIVASDHGQAFMEHDQMYHYVMPYEQLSHVPLIVARFKNGKQVGERKAIEGNFSLTRLYDLISDEAYGIKSKAGCNDEYVFSDDIGISHWWGTELFRPLREKSGYFEAMQTTMDSFNTRVSAIYHKNYKLMHFYKNPERDQLYDLKGDNGEETNVIEDNMSIACKMLEANRKSLGQMKMVT